MSRLRPPVTPSVRSQIRRYQLGPGGAMQGKYERIEATVDAFTFLVHKFYTIRLRKQGKQGLRSLSHKINRSYPSPRSRGKSKSCTVNDYGGVLVQFNFKMYYNYLPRLGKISIVGKGHSPKSIRKKILPGMYPTSDKKKNYVIESKYLWIKRADIEDGSWYKKNDLL